MNSSTKKEKIAACFVGCFYYLVLPASCLFSAVSGVIMSCYSFKGTLFFLTGSPSLTGLPLPAALALSVWELAIGIVFVILGALLLLMYNYYSKRKERTSVAGFQRTQPEFIGDATPLEENTNSF